MNLLIVYCLGCLNCPNSVWCHLEVKHIHGPTVFGVTFEADAKRSLSGHFEKAVLALAEARRPHEHEPINADLAVTDARVCYCDSIRVRCIGCQNDRVIKWLNSHVRFQATKRGPSPPEPEQYPPSFRPQGTKPAPRISPREPYKPALSIRPLS
jgi:hypothetical protein